jgi:hypothetical protein
MSVQRDTGRRRRRPTTGSAAVRHAAPEVRWTPVDQLSALARALLSEDLGGREAVPRHVAERVRAEAEAWAEHGFTDQTVRPWLDLPPAAAAYLVQRAVDPRVLELPVQVARPGAPVALRLAIASGLLAVERAYDLLVATGEHRPAAGPRTGGGVPSPLPAAVFGSTVEPESAAVAAAEPRRPVAQVIFSHPTED